MATFDIFIENSKRLKKFFSPINPLFGDPKDTRRFLFNVNGIKKAYLPLAMKAIPLIQQLMIAGSVSKFKRSHFFKSNFNSISAVHSSLNEYRLKYDLPFWIHKNYPDQINFNEFRSLFSIFNEGRWVEKPLRIMVRSNLDQDTTTVINLFILWFKVSIN
ncbi:MAG: hypothetical protein J1F67_11365 [Muribaculaceae bacterium]|nr:hypothetical protein [Muribaculaceae bacterium]